ncbi:hypothetical protein Sjap_006026 [Stephania japonica]|uniref:Peroxidase n=1 Tax=Stephania japonica TaxID=461633 RepID=A0AAP0PII7_9MAGN
MCLVHVHGAITLPHTALTRNYYKKHYNNTACRDVEEYIRHQVKIFWEKDPSITPKLLRLLYSDCFVTVSEIRYSLSSTGCDASILLIGPNSERNASQNLGLGGFAFIDKVKEVVESRCKGVVSCADILNLATRDAVHLAGAPSYPVLTGRRDGMTSRMEKVDLPSPSISWESALSYFRSKGLDVLDMTTLLGAHSMGFTRCRYILDRLYNYNGTNKPDPNMDRKFLLEMRNRCPQKTRKGQKDPLVPLNPLAKQYTFNNTYYNGTLSHRAVLGVDQQLLLGSDTRVIAEEFAAGFEDFRRSWALSMSRMGSVGVLTGTNGEIRRHCGYTNKDNPYL